MPVYSWGANSHGQLGVGFENEMCVTPQKVEYLPFNDSNIVSIKGGGGHVLFMDDIGQLYSCGWNNRGQLGLNCTENKNKITCVPREYFNEEFVESMVCGWDNSASITRDKNIYIWGSNSFQQLGVSQKSITSITKPLKLNLPQNEAAKSISFGLRHCAILTEDNNIYILGRLKVNNHHVNLHISEIQDNKRNMLKVQPEFEVDTIVSGQNHLLLLGRDKSKIIGLGDNKFGQANYFEINNYIEKIAAGWTHNGILTENHEIFLWGRNCYGQIGCKEDEIVLSPTKLNIEENYIIKELHLGSEHGLALTICGKIFTWGWNEHGNCGNGSTDNLYRPIPVYLPSKCLLAGTGAGFCYTICEN